MDRPHLRIVTPHDRDDDRGPEMLATALGTLLVIALLVVVVVAWRWIHG